MSAPPPTEPSIGRRSCRPANVFINPPNDRNGKVIMVYLAQRAIGPQHNYAYYCGRANDQTQRRSCKWPAIDARRPCRSPRFGHRRDDRPRQSLRPNRQYSLPLPKVLYYIDSCRRINAARGFDTLRRRTMKLIHRLGRNKKSQRKNERS